MARTRLDKNHLHVSSCISRNVAKPLESSRLLAGGSSMKPTNEIADIFRKYGDEYRKNHAMTAEQRKVMAAIQACRTPQLGGHQEVCDQCGHIRNCYNSCRNRHCPKCQTMAKEKWLEKRREELLPCGYFHMVFTVPHVLNPLILVNKKRTVGLLIRRSSRYGVRLCRRSSVAS